MIGRRGLLLLAVAAPVLLGATSADTLPVEDVRFLDSESGLRLVHRFHDILPTEDSQVMSDLESGFTTVIRYEFRTHKVGAKGIIRTVTREVKLHFDPWATLYVVVSKETGRRQVVKKFTSKAAAIRNAIYVNQRVATGDELQRGAGHRYFVHMKAQRNPRKKLDSGTQGGRGQSRELSVFARWVSIFVPSTQTADDTFERRTNHVYLVSK